MASMLKEFRDFAVKGNMIDLAIGVIIGAAFGAIVSSLVDDVFMPVIGLIIGGVDFSNLFIVLKNPEGVPVPSLQAAKDAGVATLNIGVFINVDFLTHVSFVVDNFLGGARTTYPRLLATFAPGALGAQPAVKSPRKRKDVAQAAL